MVVRHRKKYRKRLGSRTYHGDTKNRRGAGCRGGRGKAGSRSGHKSRIFKVGAEYRLKPKRKYIAAINIEELEKLSEKLNTNEINLTQLGIEKLLGKGKITKPIKVIVKKASKKAIEKIQEVGGEVITEATE
jgi:large subunit ribosomal protein L15